MRTLHNSIQVPYSGDKIEQVINLGIIGLNEGNGHPFSYSAIFNGYDPKALKELCPFPFIKEYLPSEHRNENFISGAKVTHIWTQDLALSKQVAAVSKIPHVVQDPKDLVGKVDAVLLARDDPWNHLEMARPFLEARIPLFIDKQLTSTVEDYQEFKTLCKLEQLIMAGSAVRYSKKLKLLQTDPEIKKTKSIHGICGVSWIRYGHHLLEGIISLFGSDIQSARSLSPQPNHDIIQLNYSDGPQVILEFFPQAALPMELRFFSDSFAVKTFAYDDYFISFQGLLREFVNMIQTHKAPLKFSEICSTAQVILAGELSKKSQGTPFNPQTLSAL